jgi:hypothetical protein
MAVTFPRNCHSGGAVRPDGEAGYPADTAHERKVTHGVNSYEKMRPPRSTRGASRGVLRCGSGAVVAKGCRTHTRVATAEAARSRRASRASRVVVAASESGATPHRQALQRWIGSTSSQGKEPERSVHRGSCGAGFKHRARDAGEMADLRKSKHRTALYRKASSRLIAARRSGPRVRQDPGVPRRPHSPGAAHSRITRAKNAPRE